VVVLVGLGIAIAALLVVAVVVDLVARVRHRYRPAGEWTAISRRRRTHLRRTRAERLGRVTLDEHRR
jgi:uncharacterized membrane-anchored protein